MTCPCCNKPDGAVELRIDEDTGEIITDYGPIHFPCPQNIGDGHFEVGSQVLVAGSLLRTLVHNGPSLLENGAILSVIDITDRGVFLHAHADNGDWVWELHPTRWWDNLGPNDLWLGIWPD